MSSMEVNKAFAAILTAGVAFGVSGFIGGLLVHPERPHHAAIQIGQPEAAQGTQAPAAPAQEPIGNLMANASVERGQQLAGRLCAACHSFNEGGRNGVGPNLYAIIGAKHAHAEGFNYSAALRGKPGPWTYEDMNAWLLKPAEYAPGTRMAFAGIGNGQQRADVIAYLRSISPNAPPPPAPQAAAPAAKVVRTPKTVVDRLTAALQAGVKEPDFVKRMSDLGANIYATDRNNGAAHAAHLKAEIDKWGPIIKKAGVYAD